jgi:hypothetical protein
MARPPRTPQLRQSDGASVGRLNRRPPIEVRRELRREVGFGCPVDGCGNPYLYWHHFDPPWRECEHHDPRGMIALCGEHHAKADAGAFTKEQLRAMKSNTAQAHEIRGKFDWMRQHLLGVVGGNFYFETHAPAIIHGMKPVSFGTDEAGHWLLDVNMLTTARQPRLQVTENFWISRGNPQDVECPPSGKALAVKYASGDKIRIEFVSDLDMSGLAQRYPEADMS